MQEVIACGLLGWKLYANLNGPIQCKALANMGVTQVVCSEKGFLILSNSGAVYAQNYKSTTLVRCHMPHWCLCGIHLVTASMYLFFARTGAHAHLRTELQEDHQGGGPPGRAALLGLVVQRGGFLLGLRRWRPPRTRRHHVRARSLLTWPQLFFCL